MGEEPAPEPVRPHGQQARHEALRIKKGSHEGKSDFRKEVEDLKMLEPLLIFVFILFYFSVDSLLTKCLHNFCIAHFLHVELRFDNGGII